MTAVAFKRPPAPERYQQQILNSIVGVPWKVRPGAPEPDDFNGNVAIEIIPADSEAKPTTSASRSDQRGTKRPMSLRKDVELDKFGYTPGCPGCDAVKFNLGYRALHTPECRARIGDLCDNDPELRARAEEARKRVATGKNETSATVAEPPRVDVSMGSHFGSDAQPSGTRAGKREREVTEDLTDA